MKSAWAKAWRFHALARRPDPRFPWGPFSHSAERGFHEGIHEGTVKAVLRRLLADDSGQDLVEYVILAALFAVALGVVMVTLDDIVANNFTATTADLTTPVASP